MRRSLTLAAALFLLLGAGAVPVLAHSYVRTLEPAGGAMVPPPGTIKMTLTFPVKKEECRATLTGPDGNEIALQPTQAGEPTDLIFLVPSASPLAPGGYTVRYTIVSADGHTQEGQWEFTVAAGQDTAGAPGGTAAPAAPAATAGPTGTAGSLWPWLVGGAVIGVAAALIRLRRLRR